MRYARPNTPDSKQSGVGRENQKMMLSHYQQT